MKIGFIGLGNMGAPMATNLAKEHDVAGFDTVARPEGITMADSAAAAGKDADVVITMLPNGAILRAVAAEIHPAMKPGAVHLDCSTVDVDSARAVAAQAEALGLAAIDAPVSGGQAGAENGQLTVMIGGDEAAVERAGPLIDCYARMRARLGAAGSGQLAKMVNQICIAGIVQGLSEALHFAGRAGLDASAVVDVIAKGAAQSWQMDNRAATMLAGKFDYGFAVDWMRKDLGYVLAEARQNGAHLPLTALVDQFYSEVQALGGGRWDTSSLLVPLERMRRNAGD